jgi:hypothetical protein
MPETLTIDTFATRVGDTFRLRVQPEQSLDLELIEVTPLSMHPAPGAEVPAARQPFSLIFRGPTNAIAPQQIYALEHGAIGTHEMFLVPLGPGRSPNGQDGMLYEAVFT